MTKRIFRSLIGISLVVCMIGMTTVFAVLYYYFDDQIINELQTLDLMALTPMDAINKLFLLREKARKL